MTKQVCRDVLITVAMDRFIAGLDEAGQYQNASKSACAALYVLDCGEAVERKRPKPADSRSGSGL